MQDIQFWGTFKKGGLESRLLKSVVSAVTFEQILPSSLGERGAQHLKIKTSTVISCSSGCSTEKSADMNCISTPFRVDYWHPACRRPLCFTVVSGTHHTHTKKKKIRGVRISCVAHLYEPLFQPNVKGDAWQIPFYFLAWLVCVCVFTPVST